MKVLVILAFVTSVVLSLSVSNVNAYPLEKVPISSFEIHSVDNATVNKISVGNQVNFVANITNTQNTTQSFVYAIWITDQNDSRIHKDWVDASLNPESSFIPSISWIPNISGQYTVHSSVWKSIDNPTALSAIWEKKLEVISPR